MDRITPKGLVHPAAVLWIGTRLTAVIEQGRNPLGLLTFPKPLHRCLCLTINMF